MYSSFCHHIQGMQRHLQTLFRLIILHISRIKCKQKVEIDRLREFWSLWKSAHFSVIRLQKLPEASFDHCVTIRWGIAGIFPGILGFFHCRNDLIARIDHHVALRVPFWAQSSQNCLKSRATENLIKRNGKRSEKYSRTQKYRVKYHFFGIEKRNTDSQKDMAEFFSV